MADWKKVVLATGTSSQYIKGDGSFATDTASLPLTGGALSGHLSLPDASGSGGVLKLGASEDIQIYHDGSNSYLDHLNTGDLKIRSLKHGGDIVFHTEASDGTQSTSALVVSSTGNIGIGATPTNNLHIEADSGDEGITIHSAGDTGNAITIDANRSGAGSGIGTMLGKWNGTTIGYMGFFSGADTTNKDDGVIKFATTPSGGSATVALTIGSDQSATFAGDVTIESSYLNINAGGTNAGITCNSDTMHFMADTNANGGTHNPFEWWHDSPTIDGGTKIMHLTTSGDLSIANDLTVTGSITTGSGTSTFGGAIISGGVIHVPTGHPIYLDGGSNTYIYEDTADSMSFVTGGVVRLALNATSATYAGKISIGTSSPSGKLTIANASASAPETITASNSYIQLGSGDYGPSGVGKFMIGFGYTDTLTNTHSPAYIGFEETDTAGDTKGDLTFYTRNVTTDHAPTERMRIDAIGNVGISDSSPSSKLTLTSDLGDGLRIQRSSFESTHYMLFDADSINAYPASGALVLNNDVSSNVVMATGGGNVGIGTDSPNLVSYGANAKVLSVVDQGSDGDYGALEIGGYRTSDGLVGDLNFINTNGSGTVQARGIIRGIRDGAKDALGLSFFTEKTGESVSEKVRISSAGNVGIGKDVPSDKLHIAGGGIKIEGSSHASAISFSGSDGTVDGLIFAQSGSIGLLDSGSGYMIECDSDDSIKFSVSDSEKVRINSSGNVGIGTTNPTSAVGVAKFLSISDAGSAGIVLEDTNAGDWEIYNTGGDLYFNTGGDKVKLDTSGHATFYKTLKCEDQFTINRSGTGATSWDMFVSHHGASDYGSLFLDSNLSTGNFYIRDSSNNIDFTVTGSGNVGIGVNPGNLLHVEGAKNSDWIAKFKNTGTTNAYGVQIDNTANTTLGEFALAVYTGSGTGMFVSSDGKFGIGTATPDKKLHVYDSDDVLATFESTDTHATVRVVDNATSNPATLTRVGDNLEIVKDGGNVSIGKDNPAQALDVEGSIISTGVILAPTYATFIHSFTDDIGTTAHYLPWGSLAEGTGNDSSATSFVVPMNMKLIKLYVRIESISNLGNFNLTATLVSKPDGSITNTEVANAVKSVNASISGKNNVYSADDFSSLTRLTKGQMGSIKIQSSGDMGGSTDFFVTSVWEMDNNTI